MSQQHQKSDQIAFHFYTKLFYVVQEARGDESAALEGGGGGDDGFGTTPRDTGRDTARDSYGGNREGKRDSIGSAKDKDKGDKGKKTDKWFNLETPDSDVLPKEIRERYKSISVWCHDASASTSSAPPPPPLEIQVVLQVPELNNKDVLVHLGDTNGTASSSRTPLIPTPRWILLETYTLEFVPWGSSNTGSTNSGSTARPAQSSASSSSQASTSSQASPIIHDIPLSTIYKHGIPLFRSLYSLLRVLPAWRMRRRGRTGSNPASRGAGPIAGKGRNGIGDIVVRVREDEYENDSSNQDPSPSFTLPTTTLSFPGVPQPFGTAILTVRYVTNPHFRVDEKEGVLSSRFWREERGERRDDRRDERAGRDNPERQEDAPWQEDEFVPTLVKNQQRDSLVGSSRTGSSGPGSLPIRREGRESSVDVAERFIIPSSRPSSFTPSSLDERPKASGLAARLRKESLVSHPSGLSSSPSVLSGISSSNPSGLSSNPASGLSSTNPAFTSTNPAFASSTSLGLSSSPSPSDPMPIRRPAINPFKGSALSTSSAASSPSLSMRGGISASKASGGISASKASGLASGISSSKTSMPLPFKSSGIGFPSSSTSNSPFSPPFATAPGTASTAGPGLSSTAGTGLSSTAGPSGLSSTASSPFSPPFQAGTSSSPFSPPFASSSPSGAAGTSNSPFAAGTSSSPFSPPFQAGTSSSPLSSVGLSSLQGLKDPSESGTARRDTSISRPGREASISRPGREASISRPGREASISRPGREASMSRPGREASISRPGREVSISRPERPELGRGEKIEGQGQGQDIPPRKRYSSSFGHRYETSSSRPSSRPASPHGQSQARYPSSQFPLSNDPCPDFSDPDDDISMFVQDIERVRPLGRGRRSNSPGRRSNSLGRRTSSIPAARRGLSEDDDSPRSPLGMPPLSQSPLESSRSPPRSPQSQALNLPALSSSSSSPRSPLAMSPRSPLTMSPRSPPKRSSPLASSPPHRSSPLASSPPHRSSPLASSPPMTSVGLPPIGKRDSGIQPAAAKRDSSAGAIRDSSAGAKWDSPAVSKRDSGIQSGLGNSGLPPSPLGAGFPVTAGSSSTRPFDGASRQARGAPESGGAGGAEIPGRETEGRLTIATSATEIDERLRRMNEEFWGSLAGLEDRGSQRREAGRSGMRQRDERSGAGDRERERERERSGTGISRETSGSTARPSGYSPLSSGFPPSPGYSLPPSAGFLPSRQGSLSRTGSFGSLRGSSGSIRGSLSRVGSSSSLRRGYSSRPGSSGSIGQGSEEVIGRLEFG